MTAPAVMCQVESASVADWWTSDDADQRGRAAALCLGCPVRMTCLEAALAARVTHGVWGGADFTIAERDSWGAFQVAQSKHLGRIARSTTAQTPRKRKAAA